MDDIKNRPVEPMNGYCGHTQRPMPQKSILGRLQMIVAAFKIYPFAIDIRNGFGFADAIIRISTMQLVKIFSVSCYRISLNTKHNNNICPQEIQLHKFFSRNKYSLRAFRIISKLRRIVVALPFCRKFDRNIVNSSQAVCFIINYMNIVSLVLTASTVYMEKTASKRRRIGEG